LHFLIRVEVPIVPLHVLLFSFHLNFDLVEILVEIYSKFDQNFDRLKKYIGISPLLLMVHSPFKHQKSTLSTLNILPFKSSLYRWVVNQKIIIKQLISMTGESLPKVMVEIRSTERSTGRNPGRNYIKVRPGFRWSKSEIIIKFRRLPSVETVSVVEKLAPQVI
jgi:hypothetical protein